jgi:hypothetical protein
MPMMPALALLGPSVAARECIRSSSTGWTTGCLADEPNPGRGDRDVSGPSLAPLCPRSL